MKSKLFKVLMIRKRKLSVHAYNLDTFPKEKVILLYFGFKC